MTKTPLRRATIWTTSIGLSLLLGLIPFVRSSDGTHTVIGTQVQPATTLVSEAGSTSVADTATLDARLDEANGHISVSLTDASTGDVITYGDSDHSYDTASIVKVDILAALLLQAEDDGRSMTVREKTLATAMIEHSDNAAASTLFEEIGGADGLSAANVRLGLTDTVVGSGGYWGLTQTSSADQVRLLKQVFTADSLLSDSARSYVENLMSNVEASQRFGVTAAADDGDEAALKVGWLQRTSTGLWDVDSIGRIEKGGHTYLVAVLSDGNATYAEGVALITAVTIAAVDATI